jgi:hypothetical protein
VPDVSEAEFDTLVLEVGEVERVLGYGGEGRLDVGCWITCVSLNGERGERENVPGRNPMSRGMFSRPLDANRRSLSVFRAGVRYPVDPVSRFRDVEVCDRHRVFAHCEGTGDGRWYMGL